MNAMEVIKELHSAGVQLWLDNDSLCYRTRSGPLPAPIKNKLKSSKPALMAAVKRRFENVNLHGCTMNELRELAGEDWFECLSSTKTLEAFAAAVSTRKLRESGIVPAHYTTTTHCHGCGEVQIFQNAPAEVLSCPWCFNRLSGRPMPKQKDRSVG